MSEDKTVTMQQLKRDQSAPESNMPAVKVGFDNLQGFSLMQRVANALAQSTLVPQQFQGNIPNCLIGLEMAQRIGASPLMVMQNLYVVYGRPGWSAKFLIASFNQCGRFSAVRYEWQGTQGKDDWGCRAYAIEKATGERIQGPLITIKLAKDEAWYDKKGSKWQTMPELMLMYRAAAWMINSHAPEISMGLNTAEEIGDTFDAMPGPEGYRVTQEDLNKVVPTESAGPAAPTPSGADAPATDAAPVPADPAKPTKGGGPTLDDAIKAIRKKDYDLAADIARGLSEKDAEFVSNEIKAARQ